MDIATMSKQELINSILSAINTAPVNKNQPSDADIALYNNFIADVNDGNDATVELPIEFALRNDMFEMINHARCTLVSQLNLTRLLQQTNLFAMQ